MSAPCPPVSLSDSKLFMAMLLPNRRLGQSFQALPWHSIGIRLAGNPLALIWLALQLLTFCNVTSETTSTVIASIASSGFSFSQGVNPVSTCPSRFGRPFFAVKVREFTEDSGFVYGYHLHHLHLPLGYGFWQNLSTSFSTPLWSWREGARCKVIWVSPPCWIFQKKLERWNARQELHRTKLKRVAPLQTKKRQPTSSFQSCHPFETPQLSEEDMLASSSLLKLLTPSSRRKARCFAWAGWRFKATLAMTNPPTHERQMRNIKGRIRGTTSRLENAQYLSKIMSSWSWYSWTQRIELTGRSQWYSMPGKHDGGFRSEG